MERGKGREIKTHLVNHLRTVVTTLIFYTLTITVVNKNYLNSYICSEVVKRPVSTQENKHRIGLDFFPSFSTGPNKVENTSTFHNPGCESQVQTGTEN